MIPHQSVLSGTIVENAKPKVVLVFPSPLRHSGYSIEMPLSILNVAAPLHAEGCDVVLFDERLSDDPDMDLLEISKDALCVGISAITGYQLERAIHFSQLIKENRADAKIVWGGYHPSLLPDQTIREDYVDIVVRGQGETPLWEIVKRLAEDDNDLNGIEGVTFKDEEGNIIHNEDRPIEDLDNFPSPPYELLDVERYFEINKGRRAVQYLSSQGCPFKCGYCVEPEVYGHWVSRSPEKVVGDIVELDKKYGLDHVSFADANFFADRRRVEEVCHLMIDAELDITWTITARADQAEKIDFELSRLLEKAGCYKIEIGVESGSQAVLDFINKKTTLEKALRSNEILRDANILGVYAFMVGFPKEIPESADEIWQTLMLIKQLRSVHPEVITVTFYVTPYPGTPIYDLASRLNLKMPEMIDEWADWKSTKVSTKWINNEEKDLVERCNSYYFPLAFPNQQIRKRMRQLRWKPVLYPLHWLSWLRCRFDFYGMPIEWRLIRQLGKMKRFRRFGSQIGALRGY